MGEQGREEGFTLIEILVVVIILAILTAAAILGVMGLSGQGVETANEADVRILQKAEEAFYAQQPSGSRRYTDETELKTERFIADESSLHDICVRADKLRYKVVPVGTDCTTVVYN